MQLSMRALNLAVGQAAISKSLDDDDGDDGGNEESHLGVLRHGGHLVIKLLESEDAQDFARICKPIFNKASWLRPKATRPSSREIYLICHLPGLSFIELAFHIQMKIHR
ncbi:uncharacterized protein LOC130508767 [Raphanus sativus]|uniref:rRNA methyltransferase 2, mitochondrial n=1 Tax=Raphanus sativus TaxID=3726 RepID=A0A9W3D9C9_RAPSA|nr:uncharacterized protein LOC130508767 [Raphanus sativus]XP_056860413.1 uncharacterized protein LOC130508767 [Raphanus sativus]XP_056860414.1 uncharacterized protein LOC130508767 [Raphanus sativus]